MSKFENKKIGLALGGGAVLGAVHVGVLLALDEFDIKVSCIAGTSIGSLVGSLHAFGIECDEIKDIAMDLTWKDISSFSLSKLGILSNNKLRKFIIKYIGDVTFEEAVIPIAMIATNISTGEKVVIKEGKIDEAIMASTCIPGIFKPVQWKDSLLVDGGLVENVPISPLSEMGADFIIAVDLSNQTSNKPPTNLVEVLLNSFHITLSTTSNLQMAKSDIIIKPNLSKYSVVNNNHTKELIDIGYQEMKKAIENYIKEN